MCSNTLFRDTLHTSTELERERERDVHLSIHVYIHYFIHPTNCSSLKELLHPSISPFILSSLHPSFPPSILLFLHPTTHSLFPLSFPVSILPSMSSKVRNKVKWEEFVCRLNFLFSPSFLLSLSPPFNTPSLFYSIHSSQRQCERSRSIKYFVFRRHFFNPSTFPLHPSLHPSAWSYPSLFWTWVFHSTHESSMMRMKGQTSCLWTPCSSCLFLSSSRLWYDSSLIMKRAAPDTHTHTDYLSIVN